jgi:hypothetical protein
MEICRVITQCRELVKLIVERALAEVSAHGETHPQWIFEWVYTLPNGNRVAELLAAPLPQDTFAAADWGALKITPLSVAELVSQIRIDREHWLVEWMDFSAGRVAE